MRITTANNDALVRVYDAESFACVNRFSFDWSINVSALHEREFLELDSGILVIYLMLTLLVELLFSEHLC